MADIKRSACNIIISPNHHQSRFYYLKYLCDSNTYILIYIYIDFPYCRGLSPELFIQVPGFGCWMYFGCLNTGIKIRTNFRVLITIIFQVNVS